jgi:signal transduction histidine kinase
MDNARTGKRRYFRFRHRIASGEVRSVEVHSGPVVIDGAQLLLSIIHDVTERDIIEAQLRRSQRLEAVGRLAGGVAHDFNNLLTVMLTAASMIERLVPDDPTVRAHMDDLRFAAGRANELTRDLLALSQRQPLRNEPMSLNDAVNQLSGMLSRTLEPDVVVRTDLDPDTPAVLADRSQIERVVMNLALNARDAMPDGGELFLGTSTRLVGELDEPLVPRGRWAVLTVRDGGSGMDADTLAHAFEPFFTTKEGEAGSGLGLATVHAIIAQTGGHVLVDSSPGEGTEFTLLLPLAPDEGSEPG